MERVEESILSLIGHTPMIRLQKISKDIPGEIWAKLEYFNPSGSVKDRIALRMIEEAERRGDIKEGATIVEPTSGNTGIGLALVCAIKGYKMIAVLPEAMSVERIRIMEHLGARVEIVPSAGDPKYGFTKEDIENTLQRAIEIVEDTPNSFLPNQFSNPDNPLMHAETTAAEIMAQTKGDFDAFVAASGTGGTFSGVARVLKEKCPGIKRIVVEPESAAVMSGGEPNAHKIQGIGEGFIPDNMDMSVQDDIEKVGDDDAIRMAQRLATSEGVLCGISGGANVVAAMEVSKKLKPGNKVVTVIPDNVFRYFSTDLFPLPGETTR